jgi:hypothetical protein
VFGAGEMVSCKINYGNTAITTIHGTLSVHRIEEATQLRNFSMVSQSEIEIEPLLK